MYQTIATLGLTHLALSPFEKQIQGFPHYGDLTNRIVSIVSMSNVIVNAIYNIPLQSLVDFMFGYYIYDLMFMMSSVKRIRHYRLFIIHHLIAMSLLHIGREYDQNLGASIIGIFESTTPLIHIRKISIVLAPQTYLTSCINSITKNSYFVMRVIGLPTWCLCAIHKVYDKSWGHIGMISGVLMIWQASIVWWYSM